MKTFIYLSAFALFISIASSTTPESDEDFDGSLPGEVDWLRRPNPQDRLLDLLIDKDYEGYEEAVAEAVAFKEMATAPSVIREVRSPHSHKKKSGHRPVHKSSHKSGHKEKHGKK